MTSQIAITTITQGKVLHFENRSLERSAKFINAPMTLRTVPPSASGVNDIRMQITNSTACYLHDVVRKTNANAMI